MGDLQDGQFRRTVNEMLDNMLICPNCKREFKSPVGFSAHLRGTHRFNTSKARKEYARQRTFQRFDVPIDKGAEDRIITANIEEIMQPVRTVANFLETVPAKKPPLTVLYEMEQGAMGTAPEAVLSNLIDALNARLDILRQQIAQMRALDAEVNLIVLQIDCIERAQRELQGGAHTATGK